MQEEMQQFRFQNVWILIDLPPGKMAIGTKCILKNKKDARGIVIRNKAILVAQCHRQEEGIDYDEVFALVARIEAIRLFLAYASFIGFMVYQMDVKSAFLYGKIEEEAPRACSMGELTFFLGLQVEQRSNGIFISQDKYVADILRKFDLESVKTATTPYEPQKPKDKNGPDDDVNVHLYRSMIGSLMYLTASRPDIMFAVSTCSRFQVTPKTSNLLAVKRIFKYLKGQPKLGLWYPRDSPFELEAYTDSDYAGNHNDRKSTTGGCQFLGRRLISWQCKKQTIVATSSTEAEYVAAAHCCGQVLKIHTDQNVADLLTKDFDGPRSQYVVGCVWCREKRLGEFFVLISGALRKESWSLPDQLAAIVEAMAQLSASVEGKGGQSRRCAHRMDYFTPHGTHSQNAALSLKT
ncbi:putative ribonuclease H-like domain-containing protein [Tanacetum coccineum]